MKFWPVTVISKYLNFAIISNDLLAILMFSFSLCSGDKPSSCTGGGQNNGNTKKLRNRICVTCIGTTSVSSTECFSICVHSVVLVSVRYWLCCVEWESAWKNQKVGDLSLLKEGRMLEILKLTIFKLVLKSVRNPFWPACIQWFF